MSGWTRCDKCGKLSSDSRICSNCGNAIGNAPQQGNYYSNNVVPVPGSNQVVGGYQNVNFLNPTEQNIKTLISLAYTIKIVLFVLAGLVFIGIMLPVMDSDLSSAAFFIALLSAAPLVITAVIVEPLLKWRAYVLQNLYELNSRDKNKDQDK